MRDGRSDAEAFERLCAPYSGMVYRHCLKMLKNPHDAEDAAQESMLRAFRAFGRFHGSGVASWLFTIAHNTCLDVLKSARYRRESVTLDSWREEHGDPADPTLPPDAAYERSEEDERLWQTVLTLNENLQTLLTLFYAEGMSYEEIAQATGLRLGTVKSRLSRAKRLLKKAMEHF